MYPKNQRGLETEAPAPAPSEALTPSAPVDPSTEPSGSTLRLSLSGSAGGPTVSHEGDQAVGKDSSKQERQEFMDETSKGEKRPLDVEDSSSFRTPSRPVSQRRKVDSGGLPTSNPFEPIMTVDDIMSPRPNTNR